MGAKSAIWLLFQAPANRLAIGHGRCDVWTISFTLRASGPILHLFTSLILWQTGRLIAGDWCGRIAALLWLGLPAVGLGSFVISTDSVMLPFWAGALYFIFGSQQTPAIYLRYMAAAGLCVGVASLAKYCLLYTSPSPRDS